MIVVTFPELILDHHHFFSASPFGEYVSSIRTDKDFSVDEFQTEAYLPTECCKIFRLN